MKKCRLLMLVCLMLSCMTVVGCTQINESISEKQEQRQTQCEIYDAVIDYAIEKNSVHSLIGAKRITVGFSRFVNCNIEDDTDTIVTDFKKQNEYSHIQFDKIDFLTEINVEIEFVVGTRPLAQEGYKAIIKKDFGSWHVKKIANNSDSYRLSCISILH